MKENYDIDFVIPWVDGSDEKWIKNFNSFCPSDKRILDTSSERYREGGLLRYWFRGIEKFAPWVRKVHFITCGQKPVWMNINAPKLHYVNHNDYIPREYLPVFSSHPIEMGMYSIPDLAEHFVYFNDDFYLTAPIEKTFFFKKGYPCDSAICNAISANKIAHIVFNNLELINRYFDKRKVFLKNPDKWFTLKYGTLLFRTIALLPWPKFTGFVDPHFAQGFTKSILMDAQKYAGSEIEETMKSRFRSSKDVNQWLYRYWQLCSGKFYPVHPYHGKRYFDLTENISEIVGAIKNQHFKEIVINDAPCDDFERRMQAIIDAFQEILPEKSSFEV